MPEIKNTFTQGKMNKDLDERIVPNGQYRDATNIQVSTSDGSDIGTVQNISGNIQIGSNRTGWECVGSIADEKNNFLYSFIHHDNTGRSAIMQYDRDGNETTVLADVNGDVLNFSSTNIITGINIIDGLLLWTDGTNEPKKINIQRCIDGTSDFHTHTLLVVNGSTLVKVVTTLWTQDFTNTSGGTTHLYLSNLGTATNPIVKPGDELIEFEHGVNNNIATPTGRTVDSVDYSTGIVTLNSSIYNGSATASIGQYIKFSTSQPLKEEHITVIKKRPTQAPVVDFDTVDDGVVNSSSINSFSIGSLVNGSTNVSITIPLNTFVVQSSGSTLVGDYTDISGFVTSGGILTNALYDADRFSINVSDVLLLSDPGVTGILPNNTQIRLSVTAVSANISRTVSTGNPDIFTQAITCTILSIDSSTSTDSIAYNFVVEDLNDLLFDKSFPRFSTRYKYEDGEYSAFGPFTQVGFVAGEFNIHPTKEPYNSGMETRVKSITLKEFVAHDIPADVVEIDLLYKPDDSSVVYSIETIKPSPIGVVGPWEQVDEDPNTSPPTKIIDVKLPSGKLAVASNSGYYKITSDNIHAALPSNQLLRAWDNVPTAAKAQEITGNRLVYGNYVQNLNLGDYVPYTVTRYERRDFPGTDIDYSDGKQSVKSQRTYQAGIVYGDKYGRETPVFSGGINRVIKIPYDSDQTINFSGMAGRSNRLYITNSPTNLRIQDNASATAFNYEPYYFKVFVKETASEYYNLVMDRVYRAEEDNNLWISFPSSDRNKIQEDDYMILKKGLGTLSNPATQVPFENKYKVIDIKNEAPEFIKKKYQEVGQLDGNGDLSTLYLNGMQPYAEANTLNISKASLLSENLTDLQEEYKNGTKFSITFKITNANNEETNSKRYKITSLMLTDSSPEFYTIILDKPIVEADGWLETSTGVLDTSLKTTIWIEERQEWEEFQGRFFVKIMSDIIADQYLESQIGTTITNTLTARTKLFYISDQTATNDGGSSNGHYGSGLFQGLHGFGSQQSNALNPANQDISNLRTEWKDQNLHFDQGEASGGWFIDAAYSAAQQPTIKTDTNGWVNESSGANIYDVSVSGTLRKATNTKVNGMTGVIETDGYYSNTNAGGFMWLKYFGNGQVRSGATPFDSQHGDPDVYGNESGKYYMHLSFSGVGPHLAPSTDFNITPAGGGNFNGTQSIDSWNLQHIHNYNQQKDNYIHCDATQVHVGSTPYPDPEVYKRQWDITYDHPENEEILKNLVIGSKFQFENDNNDTVFTILKVTKKHLYNHTAWNRTHIWNKDATPPANEIDSKTSPKGITVWAKWHKWNNNKTQGNWNVVEDTIRDFANPDNRRVCFIIELDKNPNTECYDGTNTGIQTILHSLTNNDDLSGGPVQTPGFLKFLKRYTAENSSIISDDPAVWETEPKENADLDIYYEASGAIPLKLDINSTSGLTTIPPDNRKGHMIAPIGTAVRCNRRDSHVSTPNFGDCVVKSWDGNIIELDPGLDIRTDFEVPDSNDVAPGDAGYITTYAGSGIGTAVPATGQTQVYQPATLGFYKKDLSYISAGIYKVLEIDASSGLITKLALDRYITNRKIGLPYFNCFAFGNGVESNRIRDDFNQPFISNGAKASSTIQEQYKKEYRKSGLIYSGLYNSTGGINNLNQFIMAEKTTKDLNPTYGSIQKLFSRRISLIAFCEDRVIGIIANKNALYNADGNPQLVATDAVLGDANPFVGDYGISKNPESFAKDSYRAYFTDRQRGAVLRLSMDGLTPISDAGMHDWFKDEFKDDTHINIIGSYDTYKNDYNLTFDRGDNSAYGVQGNTSGYGQTVTYSEDVKGWTSFKTFIQESGASMSGYYYTFKSGKCWKHSRGLRNTFYGITAPSTVKFLFNESPSIIKNFNALNYDGDGSSTWNYTTKKHDFTGWVCDSITTDQQNGSVSEFVEKEGKWFNYIKGALGFCSDGGHLTRALCEAAGETWTLDTSAFNFQGIGAASNIQHNVGGGPPPVPGCMDSDFVEYNPLANIDDGSCVNQCVDGCTYPGHSNYDPLATCDDGTCIGCVYGCMDPTACNYDVNATCDDGSCHFLFGCTDPLACGYDPTAICDDGSCVSPNGCTTPGYVEYDPSATCDDGSCVTQCVYGCTDNTMYNYNSSATCNQVSATDTSNPCVSFVTGCTDPTACNYSSSANTDDGSCTYGGCTDPTASNYDATAGCDDGSCIYPFTCASVTISISTTTISPDNFANDNGSVTFTDTGGDTPYSYTIEDSSNTSYGPTTSGTAISNLSPGTYTVHITTANLCTDSTNTFVIASTQVLGCTDPTATNYDPLATHDDGSCTYGAGPTYGPELLTNGDFSSSSNWSLSGTHYPVIANGECSGTGLGGNLYQVYGAMTAPLTVGTTYRLTVDVTAGDPLDITLVGTQFHHSSQATVGVNRLSLVSGNQYEAVFERDHSHHNSSFLNNKFMLALNGVMSIDNISLKEVL